MNFAIECTCTCNYKVNTSPLYIYAEVSIILNKHPVIINLVTWCSLVQWFCTLQPSLWSAPVPGLDSPSPYEFWGLRIKGRMEGVRERECRLTCHWSQPGLWPSRSCAAAQPHTQWWLYDRYTHTKYVYTTLHGTVIVRWYKMYKYCLKWGHFCCPKCHTCVQFNPWNQDTFKSPD